jgi:hypothetical protein
MKTRITLDSFDAPSFAVVPVAKPIGEHTAAGGLNPRVVVKLEAEPASSTVGAFSIDGAGSGLPDSLENWFTNERALEICEAAGMNIESVLESELLNQQLARGSRCRPRHLRRARLPFAGELRAAAGGFEA